MSIPTIFLSAATDDLKEWRDVLHKAFSRAGCMVYTQDQSLGASAGGVLQLLRQHLDKSDYIIHLAGLAYGAEPEHPAFPDHPTFRCSYTQFEYYYAQLDGRQVIAFVCAPDFPYKPFTEKGVNDADRETRRQLQLAHRERVAQGRFAGTPLEVLPHRPLSEHIADVSALLTAVAAAVGTIRDQTAAPEPKAALKTVREELLELATTMAFRADISRIDKYAPAELIGRESETQILSDAWTKVRYAEPKRPHVITFVALGGEGKTSLVAKWAADLAYQDWLGCDAAFAWSFYSQGTRDQLAASSDLFLKEALLFFGDKQMAESSRGAFDKGRRLAQLVGERRSLLILDGLEPLQYAPTSPMGSALKDQGLSSLLKGLAAVNRGLCVVTTRYSIPDLKAYREKTVPEVALLRLSKKAGVALLRTLGVKIGTQQEFETLVEDVKGHALTLNLLGTFLYDAHDGDIRKRDLVHLEEADELEQGGHAFRVMDAYVRSFESEGETGKRARAVLQLLGLFDRPASADCITALRQVPEIAGLTEPLVGMSDTQWNIALSRLETAKLLTIIRDGGVLLSLDAHPLIREYFARQVRTEQIDAWRAAHKRLYEHLCATTDKSEPKLEDLQPLYQAIAHGCQANLHREVLHVYIDRTLKGFGSNESFYTTKKLGAFGADLGAVACFFQIPWRMVSPSLSEPHQAWLLGRAAFDLRALGRLLEAIEPNRAGLEMEVKRKAWGNATSGCSLMCGLKLTLGQLDDAVKAAESGVTYSALSEEGFPMTVSHADLGDALHQVGHLAQALQYFQKAEALQNQYFTYPFLYSWQGTRYCDLLLSNSEHVAWQITLDVANHNRGREQRLRGKFTMKERKELIESCKSVSERATDTLQIAKKLRDLSSIGLDNQILCRTELYTAILSSSELQLTAAITDADISMDYLRQAGDQSDVPRGLLTRAWIRSLMHNQVGPESSQSDLDEAWEIAESGPMRLHLADIHLHRARLFFREKSYPWESPEADLAAAEKLINECGYHRRDAELADAKQAIEQFRKEQA